MQGRIAVVIGEIEAWHGEGEARKCSFEVWAVEVFTSLQIRSSEKG